MIQLKSIKALQITGYSRAAHRTGLEVKGLDILLDAGLDVQKAYEHIFITHQHLDHCIFIPQYIMNIDNANNNSPFTQRLKMSNLCLDIETSFVNSVEIDGVLYEKMQLSELIEMFNSGKNIKVLSRNLDNNEMEFKQVEKAWITKEDADVMEIEDIDTGFKIICTPDHLIFTKNRGWIEAQNLNESDILDLI